jgi:hypothetical protein
LSRSECEDVWGGNWVTNAVCSFGADQYCQTWTPTPTNTPTPSNTPTPTNTATSTPTDTPTPTPTPVGCCLHNDFITGDPSCLVLGWHDCVNVLGGTWQEDSTCLDDGLGGWACEVNTPTPTPTITPTPTDTPTVTPTITPTATMTPTPMPLPAGGPGSYGLGIVLLSLLLVSFMYKRFLNTGSPLSANPSSH